jgi:hypothetical protein
MPGLMRAVGRTAVVAGTATVVSNRVSRRQAGRWAAQDQQQAAQQQQAYEQQAYPAPPPPDDKLNKLQQLGDLKAQGVLTEAEFQVQKEKILAG